MNARDDVAATASALAATAGELSPDLGDEEHALVATYRLLHHVLAGRAGALVEQPLVVGVPPARILQVCAELDEALPDLDPATAPAVLGAAHERLLDRDPESRRRTGSWFTPQRLVDHLLDETLEPTLDEAADPTAVTVLDPACGAGLFLVAAARRIAARLEGSRAERLARAVEQLRGTDLDAAAVELARTCLGLLAVEPARPVPARAPHLRVQDALLGPQPVDLDVVVGNPPFLNRLERRTAPDVETARSLADHGGGAVGPYTDVSAVFLHRALRWVRPGGRVGLVQPQSLLAARDAAGVRRAVVAEAALESLWASDVPVFDGAAVLTCAPVLRRGTPQGPVRRSHGPDLAPVPPRPVTRDELAGEWSFLLAAGLGVPEVGLSEDAGVVGDLAACTADFRDQYYGLAGAVREAADHPDGVPLVTSGLVEPAACLWGSRPTRFLKQRWTAPVIDLPALPPELARWAEARLVPKVLVATQGPVVEAVADPDGRWLPSVPVITVAAQPDVLWHLLAALLSPPVTAHAAARYAGTALTMRAIKLSARQVAALPLPTDRDAWDEGTALVRELQEAPRGGDDRWRRFGTAMCAAYRLDGAAGSQMLDWWLGRLR